MQGIVDLAKKKKRKTLSQNPGGTIFLYISPTST
jgi:hypothetical protein